MRISNQPLITATVAATAGYATKAIWLGHIANYAIQLVYSASACDFKLQASCDAGDPNGQTQAEYEARITNWTDITSSVTASQGSGSLIYNIQNCGYNWVRVVVAVGTVAGTLAGTATITSARFNVKGV